MAVKIKGQQDFKSGNKKQEPEKMTENERPFSQTNYLLMGGCIVLIILGFLLISGGSSTDPNGYNPEIFSTRRIVTGPLLAFLGFLLMALAIICPPNFKFPFKRNK